MSYIYFDSAATTRPSGNVAALLSDTAVNDYANPASFHAFGLDAEKKIEASRSIIASTLNAKSGEIIFTGSGTEANNLAIFGAVNALKNKGGKIITTDSEHDSVYQPMKKLEQDGFEVIYLSTKNGVIDMCELIDAIDDKVILVSIMHINNETGAIYNIGDVVSAVNAAAKNNAGGFKPYIHCDAIQSYGKFYIDLSALKVDLLTISAHKIHGLKGIGALYVRSGRRIIPQILGGGQENGLRSSTLNTTGIITFGKAAEEAYKNLEENKKHIEFLYDYAVQKIKENIPSIRFNQISQNQPGYFSKYILSINAPNVRSEIMLNYLSGNKICVSSGSACSSKKNNIESKRVLLNYGLDKYSADFTLRISFSRYNTTDEIDELIKHLLEGVRRFTVKV